MSSDIEKRILNAAMEVVAREKISGTRMHMIAEEAHMSQANLHYHFSTKNAIMMALLDNIQEEFSNDRKSYINLKDKTVAENIRGIFEQKKNEIHNKKKMDYTQIDYWVQGTVNEEIRVKFQQTFDTWRNNISEILSKSECSGDNDLKHRGMLPFMAISLMLGASLQYLIDEGSFDLDEYFTVAEKMIFGQLK